MKKAGQGTFALTGLLCSGKGGDGCGYEINIREIFSSRTFGNIAVIHSSSKLSAPAGAAYAWCKATMICSGLNRFLLIFLPPFAPLL
jgi:hypothetical protein